VSLADSPRADRVGADRATARVADGLARLRQRQGSLAAAVGLFGYGLAVVSGPLLARSLMAEDRGHLASVIVPTTLFMWLVNFGIPLASAYYADRFADRHLIATAWVFAGAIGLPIVVALWFLVPLYLPDPAAQPALNGELTAWFRAFLLVGLLGIPAATAAAIVASRVPGLKYNLCRVLPALLTTCGLVGLAVAGRLDLRSALVSQFVGLSAAILATIWLMRGYPSLAFRWTVARPQLRYGRKVVLGELSIGVVGRLDQVLLGGGLVSAAALGHYVVAVTAAGLSTPIAQGLGIALLPRLKRATSGGEIAAHSDRAVRRAVMASVTVAVTLAATMPFLLPMIFGEDFRDAVAPLLVLLPGQVVSDAAYVIGARHRATGRPGVYSTGLIAAAVTTAVLIVPAVRWQGIVGAAMVTVASQVVLLGTVVVLGARGRRRRLAARDFPIDLLAELDGADHAHRV
jgi:O-antigen/teichoic acid export membrane protein